MQTRVITIGPEAKKFDELSFYEKLDVIRKRPGMYIGSKKISDMFIFIQGYRCALSYDDNKKLRTEGNLPYHYFSTFVAERYQESASMGWARILLNACDGSEEDALKLFFETMDEYRALRIDKVWRLQLSEQNIKYNQTETTVPRIGYGLKGTYRPLYSDAKNIYKLKLSNDAELLVIQTEDMYAKIEDDLFFYHHSMKEKLESCFGEIAEDAWKDTDEDFSETILE